MTVSSFFLILLSVGLSAGAQSILKFAMTSVQVQTALRSEIFLNRILGVLLNPYVLAGLAAYGFGAIIWLFVLAKTPLSTAFPFTALAILISVLAGAYLFGEHIDIYKMGAMVLIFAGILLLTLSQMTIKSA